MRHRIISGTLGLLGAWVVIVGMDGPSFAAEIKVNRIDDVVVRAESEQPAMDDLVPADDISRPGVSDTVLDAMRNLPGVQFKRTAVSGSENGKLRIRGFDETRLRIMKNGVPVHRDGSYGIGPVDWSTLPAEAVESIEIYRGAGPAKFGNALGGVVNIVTKKPGDTPGMSISSMYGSMDTSMNSITHSGKAGAVGWILSGGRYDTDGYLRNNFVEQHRASGEISVKMPFGTELGAGFAWSDQETGMPVMNGPGTPHYKPGDPDADGRELGGPGISYRLKDGFSAWGEKSFAEDENLSFNTWIAKAFDKGSARLDFRTWRQDKREVYYDAEDPGKKIYERETDAEPDNWSLNLAIEKEISSHRIEAGAESRSHGWGDQTVTYIDESYFNGSINSPFFAFLREGFKGQPNNMKYHALYLQDHWQINPALDLEFGVRQEWFKADSIDPDAFGFTWSTPESKLDESNLAPRLRLGYRPWADGVFHLAFNVAHRYPTSPEYFWWYLNNGTGFFNTGFNPEKALQYEFSYEHTVSDVAKLMVRSYYYEVDDYIASNFVAGTGSVFYNIDQVTLKGAEIGISVNLPWNLSTFANVTCQRGEKEGDPWDSNDVLEGQIPDFPETMANWGLDFKLDDLVSAHLTVNYVGDREHFNGANLKRLGSYTLVNCSAEWKVWQKNSSSLKLKLAAENIFDREYEEEAGYPMPGATLIAGMALAF